MSKPSVAVSEWWYRDRCHEWVFKRDIYRYSGHGKSGFTMHYNKQQCSRKPVIDEWCKQHAKWHGLIKP